MDSKSKPNLRTKQTDKVSLIRNMTDEEFDTMQNNLRQEQKLGHIGKFISKCAIGLSIFVGLILAIPFGWSGVIIGTAVAIGSIPVYKNFKEKEVSSKHEIEDNVRSKHFIAEADKIIASVKYNHTHSLSVNINNSTTNDVKLNEEHTL